MHYSAVSALCPDLISGVFPLRSLRLIAFEVLWKICALAEGVFTAEELFVGLMVIY